MPIHVFSEFGNIKMNGLFPYLAVYVDVKGAKGHAVKHNVSCGQHLILSKAGTH
jgi:hypothetical protein